MREHIAKRETNRKAVERGAVNRAERRHQATDHDDPNQQQRNASNGHSEAEYAEENKAGKHQQEADEADTCLGEQVLSPSAL